MLIKDVDDKSNVIKALETALGFSRTADERKRITQEIKNVRSWMRWEAEAAYEMKVRYWNDPNFCVIHDLRIEHGWVAVQIDHILISRSMDVWVCESKRFSESVAMNEHWEFSSSYMGRQFGIQSPIEQNEKHVLVLKKLFEECRWTPRRFWIPIVPTFHSAVLVSNNARITRPDKPFPWVETVVKNESFSRLVDRQISKPLMTATCSELAEFAKELVSLHRPSSHDPVAKFGMPIRDNCSKCGKSVTEAVKKYCEANGSVFSWKTFCMACQRKVKSKRNAEPANTRSDKTRSRTVAEWVFVNVDERSIIVQKRITYRKNWEDYAFFWGWIEDGESPEDALDREMREELGMDVSKEPFEYLGRFEAYDPRIDFLMVRHVFVCPTSRRAYDFVDYEGDGAEELSIADAMAAKFPSDVTAPLEAVRKKFFSAAVLAFRKRIEIPNIHKQP